MCVCNHVFTHTHTASHPSCLDHHDAEYSPTLRVKQTEHIGLLITSEQVGAAQITAPEDETHSDSLTSNSHHLKSISSTFLAPDHSHEKVKKSDSVFYLTALYALAIHFFVVQTTQ